MSKYFKLSKYLTPIFETPDGTGSWFGYYNYDPLNYDQTKMLANRAEHDAERVKPEYKVAVGFYDIKTGEWNPIGESDSYNWPQGCMLQWIPGTGNEDKAIYNTSKDNHHIAKLFDIKTGAEKEISWAIYGITPDGKKSLTIDMDRAHWTRGYHYESVIRPEFDVPVLAGDGIFEIDLEKNTRKLLIPIEDIIKTDYDPSFDNAKHWIEHIMISPNGKRFCFLHRFSPVDNYLQYTTRLILANIDGSNLSVVEGWRTTNWSHFGWDGDDAFSIYAYERSIPYSGIRLSTNASNSADKKNVSLISKVKKYFSLVVPESMKKELRIAIRGQKSYYQYYVINNSIAVLDENIVIRDFDIDGHQSYTNNGRYMITDSYPDYNKYQRLIIYDKQHKKSLVIARIFAALDKKPGSCDLHPKLCYNNDYLMVDTAYNGEHHMILFKLKWELIDKYFNE